MNSTIDTLIQDIGDLPPLPQAAQKALRLMREPNTGLRELADVIALDQTLSSQLLRAANSAMLGMQNRVTTVNRAVSILGIKTVRQLILTSATSIYLTRPLPGYDLRRGDLWRRSIGVATGAQMLAEQRDLGFAEEAYFAGLLCDIGKLAIEKLIRDRDTLDPEWMHTPFLEMERLTFGVTHAELGAEMIRRWNLPELLVNVIANHHTPTLAGEYQQMASVIHIADIAMSMLGIGLGKDGLRYQMDREAFAVIGVQEQDILMMLDKVLEQIRTAEEMIIR